MAYDIPVNIAPAGLLPTPPATLNAQYIANVAAEEPGYTVLPGNMIEDMTSTGTGALVICDQAKVETVNSLTPTGANVLLLQQQGAMLGVIYGQPTNTSVPVVFTAASNIGFVIPNGFLVGDGKYTYQVQGGGVIGSDGTSGPIPAIAIQQGQWSVQAGTVVNLETSVPNGVALSVNNPNAGTPGSATPETWYSYRSRVQQANLATCVGSPRLIKTLLGNVPGVPGNLISVQQAGGLKVVVGGSGDPYQIAYAAFIGVGDPTILVGSTVSGRNQTVSLIDYPNTYNILTVVAVAQPVTISITWDTTLSNFAQGSAFPSLVQQPIADYINGIAIGGVINFLQIQAKFQTAVAGLLPADQLTSLNIAVTINGSTVTPATGTNYVVGDSEGYYTILNPAISVTQA